MVRERHLSQQSRAGTSAPRSQCCSGSTHRWVKSIGKRAGLGHVHPHMLRGAFIVAALDAGVSQTSMNEQRAPGALANFASAVSSATSSVSASAT